MKKILAIITLLLFLVLLWCTKKKYNKCCGDKVITKEDPVVVKKDGPLVYKWDAEKAITNDLWDVEKKTIYSGFSEGKVLQITGPYFKEEGAEMGVLRAKSAFKKLGEDTLKYKKVKFESKLVTYYESAKTTNFGGTDFNWLIRNENITEIDSKTLIYFPTNSTKKISNSNITNYLKSVAKFLENNKKTVRLSGHADNQGNAVKNKRLALDRANTIKSELVRLGANADRISTISYGEEKPIQSNDTAKGRQKNRRVELEIK